MKLAWTIPAVRQLQAIFAFIAADRPSAAEPMVQRIRHTARSLLQMPLSGRSGWVAGTREMVVSGTPYLLAYRVTENSVQILAVLHAAQRWPGSF